MKKTIMGTALVGLLLSSQISLAEEAKPKRVPMIITDGTEEMSLAHIIEDINEQFAEGYQKKVECRDSSRYDKGRVQVVLKKDDSSILPFIYLQEDGKVNEKLSPSLIRDIRAMDFAGKNHLLFRYARADTEDCYDFLVKSDPGSLAGDMQELRTRFDKLASGKKEDSPEKVVFHSVSLSPSQMEQVCHGSEVAKYKTELVARIDYLDCLYQPTEGKGLDEAVTSTFGTLDNTGIFLICGNSSVSSARRCGLPPEEGNFLLSDRRARLATTYLYDHVEGLSIFTVIPLPLGDRLNERSVRIYYVKEDKNESK